MEDGLRVNSGESLLLAPSAARVKFADILLLIIAAGIAGFITVEIAKSYGLSPFLTAILAASVNSIGWIAGYQVLSRSRGWDGLQIRFSGVAGRIMLGSAAGAVALMFLSSAVAIFLDRVGIKVTDIRPNTVMPSDLGQLPLAIVSIVVIAPLGEELMFRGLLLDWLRQRVAAWPAILIMSLIFAFLHNNNLSSGISGWLIFAHRFLLGVGTSFLALQYNSLRASFVLHATNNGIACVVSALFPFVNGS
jgi:membrane protease YdiL (CAAX protease family)